MSLVSPNQQCQSTEKKHWPQPGRIIHFTSFYPGTSTDYRGNNVAPFRPALCCQHHIDVVGRNWWAGQASTCQFFGSCGPHLSLACPVLSPIVPLNIKYHTSETSVMVARLKTFLTFSITAIIGHSCRSVSLESIRNCERQIDKEWHYVLSNPAAPPMLCH